MNSLIVQVAKNAFMVFWVASSLLCALILVAIWVQLQWTLLQRICLRPGVPRRFLGRKFHRWLTRTERGPA